MKTSSLILVFLFPSHGLTQEPNLPNPWKAAPLEIPEAVKRSRVHAQTVLRGASGIAGGNLILQRIDPPVLPKVVPAAAPAVTALSPEEWAARAARRAAEPLELRLFSPTVIVYQNGISLIRWWTVDRFTGYQEYSAWVRLDLSSIYACGDLSVGSRRYCMMASMHHGTDRFLGPIKVPALSDFKDPMDILLTKGDSTNQEAMEPLVALLEKYDTEGEQIAATAARIKADQEAREAWEKVHPVRPEDEVIKFWPIKSSQYSTNPVKAAR